MFVGGVEKSGVGRQVRFRAFLCFGGRAADQKLRHYVLSGRREERRRTAAVQKLRQLSRSRKVVAPFEHRIVQIFSRNHFTADENFNGWLRIGEFFSPEVRKGA